MHQDRRAKRAEIRDEEGPAPGDGGRAHRRTIATGLWLMDSLSRQLGRQRFWYAPGAQTGLSRCGQASRWWVSYRLPTLPCVGFTDSITVIETRFGRPATEALVSAVRETKRADPLAPVTVFAPNNYAAVALRRQLGSGAWGRCLPGTDGVIGVDVTTPIRLAERLAAPALVAQRRRPLPAAALTATVQKILARSSNTFEPTREHRATIDSVTAAHRDLRAADPSVIGRLAGKVARVDDLLDLHDRVRRALSDRWYDERDLLDEAITALRSTDAIAGRVGTALLTLPGTANLAQATFLAALAQRNPLVIVAPLSGVDEADRCVRDLLRAVGQAMPHRVGRHKPADRTGVPAESPPLHNPVECSGERGSDGQGQLFSNDPPGSVVPHSDIEVPGKQLSATSDFGGVAHTPARPSPTRLTVIEASDREREVAAAVDALLAAASSGTAFETMAVVFTARDPYSALLVERLDAAGIRFNGPVGRPLAGSHAGRLASALLRLAGCRPTPGQANQGANRQRAAVRALLHSAPLRLGSTPIDSSKLDATLRHSRLSDDISGWAAQLANLDDLRRAEALGATRPTPASPAVGSPQEGGRAGGSDISPGSALRQARNVVAAIETITSELATADTWTAAATVLCDALNSLLAAPSGPRYATELRALDQVRDRIMGLAVLDDLDVAFSVKDFGDVAPTTMGRSPVRLNNPGEGVLIGPMAIVEGAHLDLVIIVGCAEGSLPGPVSPDSLLSEEEREAAGPTLRKRSARPGDQHRLFLAALASSDTAITTVPRLDMRSGRELLPSRYVVDAVNEFLKVSTPGTPAWRPADPRQPIPALVLRERSQRHSLMSKRFQATAQDFRTSQALLLRPPMRSSTQSNFAPLPQHPQTEELIDLSHRFGDDRRFSAGLELALGRASPAFTRFDGNLAHLAEHVRFSALGRVSGARTDTERARRFSPHSLSGWVKCPFAWLAQNVWGVGDGDENFEPFDLSPLEVGRLVHAVMEAWNKAETRRGADADSVLDPKEQLRELVTSAMVRSHASRGVRSAVLREIEIEEVTKLVTRLVDHDVAERQGHGLQVWRAEASFGRRGEPELPLVLRDGSRVFLHGRIDRIDISADGSKVLIEDYKVRSSAPKITPEDPTERGTEPQLPIYAMAAAQLIRAAGGPEPQQIVGQFGVLSRTKNAVETVAIDIDGELLDRATEQFSDIVEHIDHAHFVAKPTSSTRVDWVDCAYCDPDGLGTSTQQRILANKRDDPAIAELLDRWPQR